MTFNKKAIKSRGLWAWFGVSIALIAVLLTVNILALGVFRDIIDTVLGGLQPKFNPDVQKVYTSDYESKKEVLDAGNKLNVKIEQEGAVLLLNEKISPDKNSLPLARGAKVSVFGHNSVNLVLSGSGSGNSGSKGAKTLYDGLEKGGIEYNPHLKKFYESSSSGDKRSSSPKLSEGAAKAPTLDIGETPIDKYGSGLVSSFKDYSDAAIVVISRIGGESFDLPREQSKNGGITGNHYLQLDRNEYDMLDMVTSRFDNVIVLLNTLTSFQLDFIAEYNNTNGYNKRIDSVMWIGGPGISGADAIGSLLNGEVNPSGRTSDIYVKDFSKDPTWQNFGDNSHVGSSAAYTENNAPSTDGHYMVAYEEGVYVGYRYYETRGYEEANDITAPDLEWYNDNVVFPFGYGLSYSAFTQDMTVTPTTKEGKVTGWDVSVSVKNVSGPAGKEVIELYVTLPYTRGGIEKSHVQLVDYAKVELDKGASTAQPVKFRVDLYDLASYDYNDANGNGFCGYETEAGEYTFYVAKNSHVDDLENVYDKQSVTLDKSVRFEKDPVTGETVQNLYTEQTMGEDKGKFLSTDYRLADVSFTVEQKRYTRKGMSRVDFEGTFPKPADESERGYQAGEKDALKDMTHNNTDVENAVNEPGFEQKTNVSTELKLRDMFGKDYDDEQWMEILDALTYGDMIELVNYGAFRTSPILSIGKNLTNDSDGPVGFVNFMVGLEQHYKGNPSFACEIVVASTWNKDLAYRMGEIVGETGLYGDEGGNGLPYTGWYAPAVNIHRSPFSGRNYEYYSEDPILSGKMAVNVINGCASKGVYTDLKHLALNDQETNRDGVATFCTEQALREIYLKPFELAVKGDDDPTYSARATEKNVAEYKGTTGMMSSFNRIGTRWTGGDYRLMTTILRGEWGFRGLVISDYKTDNTVMNSRQMLYAGNDLILASLDELRWNDSNPSSKEDMYVLRNAAHNILYTVANSNSINVDVIGYNLEVWAVILIAVDVFAAVCIAVWGFFAVSKALGKGNSYKEVFINTFMRNKRKEQTETNNDNVEIADTSTNSDSAENTDGERSDKDI